MTTAPPPPPPPPRRGPAGLAPALGVLAVSTSFLLVAAVLVPPVAVVLSSLVLPLRVLGLVAGVAAVVVGVRALRAARARGRGRGAGATAVALGVLGVVGVVAAVPVVVRSSVDDLRERQAAAAAAGPDRPAEQDVRVDRCAPVPSGYAAHLSVTNSTGTRVRYDVTVEVLDGSGGSRGYLVSAAQSGIDPGRTVQQVVEGSVALGTDGTCRVVDATRAPA